MRSRGLVGVMLLIAQPTYKGVNAFTLDFYKPDSFAVISSTVADDFFKAIRVL